MRVPRRNAIGYFTETGSGRAEAIIVSSREYDRLGWRARLLCLSTGSEIPADDTQSTGRLSLPRSEWQHV